MNAIHRLVALLLTLLAVSSGWHAAVPSAQTNADRSNALLSPTYGVLPLYPIAGSPGRKVAFYQQGSLVTALDQAGAVVWSKALIAGGLFGVGDFDGDGWPDIGLLKETQTGQICGTTPRTYSFIELYHGNDGTFAARTEPIDDICWNFDGTIYPTSQWSSISVLFGPSPTPLFLSPYYATTSWFYTWDAQASSFRSYGLYFPSTTQYDLLYVNARPNAYDNGTKYVAFSHPANGLIVNVDGQQRAIFFTTGRVVQYAVAPLSQAQLLVDHPFLSGNRLDLGGRNKGLFTLDPDPAVSQLALISGTSTFSVYTDLLKGAQVTDPWAEIERHVTLYNYKTDQLQQRFYSYAHDANDGYQYKARPVYPASPYVRTFPGQPSRLAYNVYDDGHWWLHVTQPGSVVDRDVFKDLFLWDIRDLDGDGTEEWVTSPARYTSEPDVPGYYFPERLTFLYRWQESTSTLIQFKAYPGMIPYLQRAFHNDRQSVYGGSSYVFPALVQRSGSTNQLIMLNGSNRPQAVPLGF
jgi:hypothetical protein